MDWPLTIAAFIIGLALGYVGRTVFNKKGYKTEQDKAIEQTKYEFSQYKEEVQDHFAMQHQQLNQLSQQLSQLNKQWNEAAGVLDPQENYKPLPTLELNQASNEQVEAKAPPELTVVDK